jgi:hypothetical protein
MPSEQQATFQIFLVRHSMFSINMPNRIVGTDMLRTCECNNFNGKYHDISQSSFQILLENVFGLQRIEFDFVKVSIKLIKTRFLLIENSIHGMLKGCINLFVFI